MGREHHVGAVLADGGHDLVDRRRDEGRLRLVAHLAGLEHHGFGGVKLGAGGLVRAYTDAVAQALKDATYVPRLRFVALACDLPYALEGWLRRELSRLEVRDLDVVHGIEVGFRFSVPEGEVSGLRQRLDDGGQGRLRWRDAIPGQHR